MNKISKILILLFILTGIIYFNSCVKEKFDAPTLTSPAAGLSSNMTIAGFNQFYIDSLASGFGLINQDIILKGVVCGNDESGNIYKNIYIEDNTGGLDIAIDQPSLYTTFRVGQTIYIKCKGLYLGNYGGVPELGYTNSGAIGRIPSAFIKDHLFLDGFPGTRPTPTTTTIAGFSTAAYSTLIRLDSVHFQNSDVGQVFCISTTTATNRILYDKASVNTIAIRTSSYANFAGKHVPAGVGSVVGILSYFSSQWQLTLRDSTDLIGF